MESVRTGCSCSTCTCAFGVALTLQVWKSVDITFQSASRRFMSAVLSLYEETSQLKRSARKSCSTQIPEPEKNGPARDQASGANEPSRVGDLSADVTFTHERSAHKEGRS